jgi:autotransporter-associated beta strand protein
LDVGATTTFELTTANTVGGNVNDLIQVNGNVNLNNNIVSLDLLALPQTGVPYTLISYTGTRSGTLSPTVNFLGGSRFAATITYDDAGKKINVTLSGGPAALDWSSMAGSEWDNGVTTNWFNTGASAPDAFFPFDSVSFGDTPGLQPIVDIPSGVTVRPSGVVINSTGNAYSIQGSGSIGGTGGMTKSGGSTLNLLTANSFAGGLTVNGGMVRLSAGTSGGTGTLIVHNNAVLTAGAAHANAITLSGGKLGASIGNIAQFSGTFTATAGTTSTVLMSDPDSLTLNAEMNFTGNLQGGGDLVVVPGVNQLNPDGGVGFRLRGTGSSSFTGTIIVSNNVKAELQTGVAGPFSPAGSGKIILICGIYDGNDTVTCPADGGYSEFQIRNNFTNHTVVGNNVEVLGTGTVVLNFPGGPPVGSISSLGNLRVGGGQQVGVIKNSGNAQVWEFRSVTLTGGEPMFSPKLPGFGAVNATGSDLQLSNITQLAPSGIIMNGLRTLYLTGTNGYTGNTTVSNGVLSLIGNSSLANSPTLTVAAPGTLSVTGRTGGTLTLASGQTLKGDGSVAGNLIGGSGSSISPGFSVGALTVSGTVLLQGVTAMEIDKASSTHDVLQGAVNITYGGTLALANLSTPLADGDSFQLFSAGSYSGAFAAIVPGTPGPNLVWNTSTLATDGRLRVAVPGASQPYITGIVLNGSTLTISGTNATTSGDFYVLSSTNVAQPIASWQSIATNSFSGGNFSVPITINSSEPQRFYLLQVP